jgi:hypothetical protein
MNRMRAIAVVCVLPALAAGAALFTPPARAFFALNRLDYLLNDHRYLRAMRDWEGLIARRPAIADDRPDFERRIIGEAMSYYTSPAIDADPRARADLVEFLALIAERPELAPLGRRLQLRLSVRDDRATTPTLANARAMLDGDGYDSEALWWVACTAYDPHDPLTIPAELIRFREPILRPLAAGQVRSPEDDRRNLYLRALIALADRDWARAAYLLEIYDAGAAPTDRHQLPLALALLRSGQPDAALAPLQQRLASDPTGRQALALLLEATLRMRRLAWAAEIFDRLAAVDPAAATHTLADTLGIERPGPMVDPLTVLAGGCAASGPFFADARLWQLLDRLAKTPAQRAAVDHAAEAMIERALPADPDAQAILLGWCLRERRVEPAQQLCHKLANSLPERALDPNAAARAAAFLLRGAGWPDGPNPPAPLKSLPVNRLLTRDATLTMTVDLPTSAALLLLQATGYPSGSVGPLAHVDLGPFGEHTFYVAGDGGNARLLPLPLIRPIAEPTRLTIGVSLLNGTPAEDRHLYLTQILVF